MLVHIQKIYGARLPRKALFLSDLVKQKTSLGGDVFVKPLRTRYSVVVGFLGSFPK